MSKPEPILPSSRAFVVQFHSSAAGTRPGNSGRAEHVISGQSTHFESWQDLQQFFEKILDDSEKPP